MRRCTTAEKNRQIRERRSPITYFRGDDSDGVQARAFIRGRTHFLLMYRRLAAIRMRDEMTSGNLSSVIYDTPRRTGALIMARRAEARSRDVPRIHRDPPTCGHCVLAMRGLPIPILPR